MSTTPDIVVRSPDGRVQLVVEVKAKRHASPDWAAKMRRNLVAHGMIPHTEFFMLALPDRIHIWHDTTTPEEIPPEVIVPTPAALGRYVNGLDLEHLGESSLELLISSWLSDLASFGPPESAPPEQAWLSETGLAQAIFRGSVDLRAAA